MTQRPPHTTHFPYTTLFRSIPVAMIWVCPHKSVYLISQIYQCPEDFPCRPPCYHQEGLNPMHCLCHTRAYVCIQLFLRSEEHTSELQSRPHLVCRLLLEKKN